MCVVNHSYDGLGRAEMELLGCMHAGRISGDAGALPECEVIY